MITERLTRKTVLNKTTNAKAPKIFIVGDLMLDHYIEGDASRLSPEAPVPVVNVMTERYVLGGAANVALNLLSLGAIVSLAGLVGNDNAGNQLVHMAQQHSIDTSAILTDSSRPTTVKSRVMAQKHQLLRIDREITTALDNSFAEVLLTNISRQVQQCDMLILSDYNKGVLRPDLAQDIIALANKAGRKVIIDPKGHNYEKYKGAFIIKPNRKELQEVAHIGALQTKEQLERAALQLRADTQSNYIITTLSQEGMALASEQGVEYFPVKATEVYDVTGAGDTVIAVLAYCITLGFSVEEACEVANYAAAVVVKRAGSATATLEEIINSIETI